MVWSGRATSSSTRRHRLRGRHRRAHHAGRRARGPVVIEVGAAGPRRHAAAQPAADRHGAGMLWVGWFGFNAGSALGATAAPRCLVVTQVSAPPRRSPGWRSSGRARQPVGAGIATGASAGLAAITPASGMVGPIGALVIGVRRRRCYWARPNKARPATTTRSTCSACTASAASSAPCSPGLFASQVFGGLKGDLRSAAQLGIQFLARVAHRGLPAGTTCEIAKAVDAASACASRRREEQGLDLHQHGESGYNL